MNGVEPGRALTEMVVPRFLPNIWLIPEHPWDAIRMHRKWQKSWKCLVQSATLTLLDRYGVLKGGTG